MSRLSFVYWGLGICVKNAKNTTLPLMGRSSKSNRNKATTATGNVVRIVRIGRKTVRRVILGPAAIALRKQYDERDHRLQLDGKSIHVGKVLGAHAFGHI